MKALLIISGLTLLLLLFPTPASTDSAKRSNRSQLPSSLWTHEAVKVYFVQNMFTPAQKQVLWQEMVAWSHAVKESRDGVSDSSFIFVDAGYTGGLIDCMGCLTITRQQVLSNNPHNRASFNYLRRSHQGGLVSAWIGLNSGENKPRMLRELVRKALEEGLGS